MALRIGIYGGGQLGAYLCQAATRLGFHSSVLAFHSDSMALAYADQALVAAPDDALAVDALIQASDVVTFEVENVPPAVREALAAAQARGAIRIAPSLAVMTNLQNKFRQKQWLKSNGFATPEFVRCDAHTSAADLFEQFGASFVQKRCTGGYDGRGVQVVRDSDDADKIWRENAYAERFVDNKRELCVLVARGQTGQIRSYPVVEMFFDTRGNVLREAHCPSRVPEQLDAEARALAERIVRRLEGVGVFAIEMFLVEDGTLLINEISPRVHNTGHLTMEAHSTCQYEQHIRAITGMPLGSVEQSQSVVMRNVLHSEDLRLPEALSTGATLVDNSTTLHWYGKRADKPLRKLGHITSLGPSTPVAAQSARSVHADMFGAVA